MTAPWPPGTATGIGSLPGTDPAEAVRLVFGELPELPHLPELPARGPGAALIGRGAALLAGLHVDLQPAGWRLVPRGGLDERRARDWLARDLDGLEEQAAAYAGPLKLQAAGPWTLAASVELPRGGRALADAGAVRDLVASLAEGLAVHVAAVHRRLPGADVVLQLDEPMLPAVLAGRVPTASGFGALPAVEAQPATDGLRTVLTGSGAWPVVHCCADGPPLELLVSAGAQAVSIDLTRLGPAGEPGLGTAVEAGVALLAGVVPAAAADLPDPRRTVEPVRRIWHRLGLPAGLLDRVVVTPTCGLAGATPAHARAALAACTAAARELAEGER